jgi:hypothetical protein
MEMPNLPNGQEKAFAVQAELGAVPEGLTAGTEIRVKSGAQAPRPAAGGALARPADGRKEERAR